MLVLKLKRANGRLFPRLEEKEKDLDDRAKVENTPPPSSMLFDSRDCHCHSLGRFFHIGIDS